MRIHLKQKLQEGLIQQRVAGRGRWKTIVQEERHHRQLRVRQ